MRKRYEIDVWGTVLFLDLGSNKVDEAAIDAAVEDVKKFVYGVDEDFSTYKDGSFVSRLRRGEIAIEQCPTDVQEVWQLCAVARDLTGGAFHRWQVDEQTLDRFDPASRARACAYLDAGELLDIRDP